MNRLKQAWLALCVVALAGCTFPAEVDLANSPKRIDCTDTRDGERFSFRPSDVRDARAGVLGGETCFKVTDLSGNDRLLCESHTAFLKCEPQNGK